MKLALLTCVLATTFLNNTLKATNGKSVFIEKADSTIHISGDTVKDSKTSKIRLYGWHEDVIKNLADIDRAALGLISTFIADGCEWDGAGHVNMNCKFTTLLGFGHQCSDKQFSFLRHWFRNDKKTLEKLNKDSCASTPPGASRQYSFEKIDLLKRGNKIIVAFWASDMSLKREMIWKWKETLEFKVGKNESLILINQRGISL